MARGRQRARLPRGRREKADAGSSRCPEPGPRRAALTLRTEPGAEPPGVPDAAGMNRRPPGRSRRRARGVRSLPQRERASPLGSGSKPCSRRRGAQRPRRREGSGAGAGQLAQPAEMRAPGRAAAAAEAAAEKNESARERERETGRARRTRRGAAAGRAGAPRSTRGRADRSGSAPAPTAAAAALEKREPGPASLRGKCGPSTRRFRRPFKREHLGDHPRPRASTAGRLGL